MMKLDYPIRLQAYLAKSGFGSRRFCEELITSGRVKVNAKIVRELGTRVVEDDIVQVDDVLAEPADRLYYYALHKPRGYVCTNYDPNETLYARSLITVPENNLLFHIGRLDKDSTGLILFTNDGNTAQKIMHPSSVMEKEYLINTDKPVLREHLEEMLKGIFIDGPVPYRIKRFKMESRKWIKIILTEGKNREIRKLFEHFGYQVKKLIRIRIGEIELADLKPGAFRKLTTEELSYLTTFEPKKESAYDNSY